MGLTLSMAWSFQLDLLHMVFQTHPSASGHFSFSYSFLIVEIFSVTSSTSSSDCIAFPIQVVERIKKYFDILGGPATFIQVCISFACFELLKHHNTCFLDYCHYLILDHATCSFCPQKNYFLKLFQDWYNQWKEISSTNRWSSKFSPNSSESVVKTWKTQYSITFPLQILCTDRETSLVHIASAIWNVKTLTFSRK